MTRKFDTVEELKDASKFLNMNLIKPHFDSDQELMLVGEQLLSVESKIYEKQYKELKLADGAVVPITSNMTPADLAGAYDMFDTQGQAGFISNWGTDTKSVSASKERSTYNAYSCAVSYEYSWEDLLRAAQTGTNVDAAKALAARKAVDELKEQVGFYGEAKLGLKGLNEIVELGNKATIADPGSGTAFDDKDADQIIADFTNLWSILEEQEAAPNKVILPVKQFAKISTARLTDSDATILNYLKVAFPTITSWMSYSKLKGAGEGAKDRMVMFSADPDNIRYEMPVKLAQRGPDTTSLMTKVTVYARVAGIICPYPYKIVYGDGI